MPAKLLGIKQIVVRIGVVIFVAEFLIMLLLTTIPYEFGRSPGALIDGFLLTALTTPSIYFWVVRPFVNARDEALAQISHLALTDPLTQLANRRLLIEHLEKIIAGSNRHRTYSAVLLIDLDNFKQINDCHGHAIGDAVLVEVARRLHSCVRAEDVVGRLGGDEFIVLASNLNSEPEAAREKVRHLAETLIKLMSEPLLLDGKQLQIGASVGVRLLGPGDMDATAAINDADAALYRAKGAGKGHMTFY